MAGRMTRRRFLVCTAAGGAAAAGGTGLGLALLGGRGRRPTAAGSAATPGRVVLARDDALTDKDGWVQAAVARKMLDAALVRLTGKTTPREAWRSLFTPRDRVGLKVNCLAGKRLSSQTALVEAIITGVRSAGVEAGRIFVWERSERELKRAGFTINRHGHGVRVLATDSPGVGYEAEPQAAGEIGGCFSRCLGDLCTAIVNVPILKDHDLAGVTVGMKNFFGGINNPNKYHDNRCDPYIADMMTHRYVREKLRLTVCDAALAQCEAGPAHAPKWAWRYSGLLVGRDPVALDVIGHEIIAAQRKAKGLPTLAEAGREPTYILTAEKRKAGIADRKKIELVEV